MTPQLINKGLGVLDYVYYLFLYMSKEIFKN